MYNNHRKKFRKSITQIWLKTTWPLRQDFCRRGLVGAFLLNWNYQDLSWHNSFWSWTNVSWGDATIGYNRNFWSFNWSNSSTNHTLPTGLFGWWEIEISWRVNPTALGNYYVSNKDGVTSNREWTLALWNYPGHYWELWALVFTSDWNFSYAYSDQNIINAWVWQQVWFSRDTWWNIKLYLNWKEVASYNAWYISNGNINDVGQAYNIGYRPYWPDPWYFNWGIQNNLIYNRILTQEERRQNYLFWLSQLH